jgi:hypothetical protein
MRHTQNTQKYVLVSTVYPHSYSVVIKLGKSKRTECLEQEYTCEKWKIHAKYSSETWMEDTITVINTDRWVILNRILKKVWYCFISSWIGKSSGFFWRKRWTFSRNKGIRMHFVYFSGSQFIKDSTPHCYLWNFVKRGWRIPVCLV